MKINLKLRLQNKAVLASIIGCIVAAIYQILGMVGIIAPISEETLLQIVGVALNVLVFLGVLTDPTTAGLSDSKRAMRYDKPVGDDYIEVYDESRRE